MHYLSDLTDATSIRAIQYHIIPYHTIPYHSTPYAELKMKIEMRNRVESNFTNTKQKEGRRKGNQRRGGGGKMLIKVAGTTIIIKRE